MPEPVAAETPALKEQKPKNKKEITFPFEVQKGSVTVKISRTPFPECEALTLSYDQDGVRKRPTFTTFASARAEADTVAGRLASTDADILTLISADRAAYLRARQLLDHQPISPLLVVWRWVHTLPPTPAAG